MIVSNLKNLKNGDMSLEYTWFCKGLRKLGVSLPKSHSCFLLLSFFLTFIWSLNWSKCLHLVKGSNTEISVVSDTVTAPKTEESEVHRFHECHWFWALACTFLYHLKLRITYLSIMLQVLANETVSSLP